MNLMKAIETRHSVRSYIDKKIDGETLEQLTKIIDSVNRESDLNIQLCLDEPTAFTGMMAKYGKFNNVNNYIAIVGKKTPDLEEKTGYFGEQIVLKAQQLGLNTCWVALSFNKNKSRNNIKIGSGEKLVIVISIGYGETQGVSRKTKSIDELSIVEGDMPDWFKSGMEAVQLAPTAMNQQKFKFKLIDGKVTTSPGVGFYTKLDLGIAKYHFEIGSGGVVVS